MVRSLISLFATPAILVGVRLSGALAAFLTSLVLARSMEQDDMGRALTLVSLTILLGILPTAGMEAGAVRFIAKYRQSQDDAKARGFLQLTNRLVIYSSGFTLAVILIMFAVRVIDWHPVIALVLVAALITSALRVGAAKAMAFNKVVRSQLPMTFLRQTGFLAILLFCLLFVGQLSVVIVVAAFLAASSFALFVQHVLLRNISEGLGEGPRDLSDWRAWTAYGLQMMPTQAFVQYGRDLVLIIAAWSLASEDIAVLAVATALVAFVKFGVAATNLSITPKMATLIASKDEKALTRLIDISNHMKLWPVLIAFLALWAGGETLLSLFGPGFVNATPILLILMLEPLALALFGPAGQHISLSGHQAALIPMAVAAIVTMCLAVTLGAWTGGLAGAAMGVGVTWWVWCAMLAVFVRRKSGIDVTAFRSLYAVFGGGRA